jgi:S1-C subfamily serine protease
VGTAVVLESSGVAVTTARLGRRALTLKAETADGRRLSAMVVGRDDESNIAVLTLCCSPRPLAAVRLADAARVRAGDRVLAIGAPYGLAASATASVVSGFTASEGEEAAALIQTGPSVTEGYAGGPLLDTTGAMIGLVVGHAAGAGLAMPAGALRPIVAALLEEGRVRRGSLGMIGQTLHPALAEALGAHHTRGVVVVDVRAAGPAARAGLRPGDVVLALDERPSASAEGLARRVGRLRPGTVVTLKVWRDGEERTLAATVDDEPADDAVGSLRWRTQALFGADVVGIGPDMGVMVAEIDADGPAARAGVRRADVIREVNGHTIRSLGDFERALAGMTLESRLLVLLQRGRTSLYVTFAP